MWLPGESGNPGGRPKGSRNKATLAVREWATGIVEDPQVQARLLADARAGRLHPSVMTALMAYAYGKPRERMIPMSEIEDARRSLQVKRGIRRTAANFSPAVFVGLGWLKQQQRYETDLVHVLRRRIVQLRGAETPRKREHENQNEDDGGDARESH